MVILQHYLFFLWVEIFGDKKQNTKETVYGKNRGRSNETTDEEQALLEFERKVKKKKEEGYVETREDAIMNEKW